MDVKKYLDFSREYIKKAVKYGKSKSASVVNSAKSIIKSVISILNSVQSYVIKRKGPKAQAFKTTVSSLLVTATVASAVIYGGKQVKKVVAPPETAQQSTQQTKNQEGDRNLAGGNHKTQAKTLVSYDKNKQCEANNLPSYINISMTWGSNGKTMSMVDDFKKLSPPSVIITAAGNAANDEPPKPLVNYNKQLASKEYDVILVGSVDPFTKRSVFSQKGEEVAIVAPSDYMISTTSKHGYYQKFSGTSGATPLVTGALAGFTWLSGYQPTGAEAKVLLKNTAIPLRLSNEKPQMNGPGMLNAYKLGMVGKRLKEQCGSDIYCYKNKIREPAAYRFSEDTAVLELVDKAFPECNADNKCLKKRDSCQDTGEIFDRLRKAAFLNPSKKEYWRALACIHSTAGFTDSAEGMMNIYKGLLGEGSDGEGRINNSCQVDEDCVYTSDCSLSFSKKTMGYTDFKETHLRPANKDHVSECQWLACDDSGPKRERQLSKEGETITMRLSCVNSKCVEAEAAPEESSSKGKR